MDRSIRGLMQAYLSSEQIDASFEIMGLDTRLIEDGTYLAIEDGKRLVGCGGWSARTTLYGGDHSQGRSDASLDPARDAARIRAMYTDPEFTRRGIGAAILQASGARKEISPSRTHGNNGRRAAVPRSRLCGTRRNMRRERERRAYPARANGQRPPTPLRRRPTAF